MKSYTLPEKRKFCRYDTDAKVQFYVTFDIHTRVEFQIIGDKPTRKYVRKYSGISKNVNPEGLAFRSGKRLHKGDRLVLFVRVPTAKKSIRMDGEVRWCKKAAGGRRYDTGVRLMEVEGTSVERSVVIDPRYKVAWSIVLESVFGNFKHLILKPQVSSAHHARSG